MALADTAETNRYLNARRNPDFTIDQDWASYTRAEHDRWDRLFRRSQAILRERACDEFLAAMDALQLSEAGIPDMAKLSDRLETITGWRVVPVVELVPDDVFFDHLANRRFPAGAFIRPEAQMDYLEEPDIFHDVFGHVPLLANPVFADFMQAYGKGGQRALDLGCLKNLARLYWYTVEFGLIRSARGPAHLRRRHHVVDDRKRVRAGQRLAASRRVQSRTRHAHELHHRRFPADLFRDRQFPVPAGRMLPRLRPDLCVDRRRERHRARRADRDATGS